MSGSLVTQTEFNKMLQTVQQIEIDLGLKILELRIVPEYHDKSKVYSADQVGVRGIVFSQYHPMRDDAHWWINMDEYRSIVYSNPMV